MCGTSRWEWEEDPFAYEAHTVECLGCKLKDMTRSGDPDRRDKPGESITLLPRGHTGPEPIQRRVARRTRRRPRDDAN